MPNLKPDEAARRKAKTRTWSQSMEEVEREQAKNEKDKARHFVSTVQLFSRREVHLYLRLSQ
jgi:hypothetical protein